MLAPGLNKATVMSTRAPLTRERHTAKVVRCAALSFLMSGKKCCIVLQDLLDICTLVSKCYVFMVFFFVFFDMFILLKAII